MNYAFTRAHSVHHSGREASELDSASKRPNALRAPATVGVCVACGDRVGDRVGSRVGAAAHAKV